VLCRILFWQDLKVGVKFQFRWENQNLGDPLLFHVYYYYHGDLWFCLILGKTGLQYFKDWGHFTDTFLYIYIYVIHILPKQCTTLNDHLKGVQVTLDLSFISNSSFFSPSFIRVIHKVTLSFTPLSPLFQWYPQSKEILLNLSMKCWNLAFNAQGSRTAKQKKSLTLKTKDGANRKMLS
jgi:hypothetical protein